MTFLLLAPLAVAAEPCAVDLAIAALRGPTDDVVVGRSCAEVALRLDGVPTDAVLAEAATRLDAAGWSALASTPLEHVVGGVWGAEASFWRRGSDRIRLHVDHHSAHQLSLVDALQYELPDETRHRWDASMGAAVTTHLEGVRPDDPPATVLLTPDPHCDGVDPALEPILGDIALELAARWPATRFEVVPSCDRRVQVGEATLEVHAWLRGIDAVLAGPGWGRVTATVELGDGEGDMPADVHRVLASEIAAYGEAPAGVTLDALRTAPPAPDGIPVETLSYPKHWLPLEIHGGVEVPSVGAEPVLQVVDGVRTRWVGQAQVYEVGGRYRVRVVAAPHGGAGEETPVLAGPVYTLPRCVRDLGTDGLLILARCGQQRLAWSPGLLLGVGWEGTSAWVEPPGPGLVSPADLWTVVRPG